MATRAENPTLDELRRLYARTSSARSHYVRRIARMIAWQSVELRSELNPTGLYLVSLAKRAMERDV